MTLGRLSPKPSGASAVDLLIAAVACSAGLDCARNPQDPVRSVCSGFQSLVNPGNELGLAVYGQVPETREPKKIGRH